MRSRRPFEHLNDEQLLAYLDGEISLVRIRSARNHLRLCWKCRAMLAELEAQVETISRLFLAKTNFDAERSKQAKERFFEWRDTFERQRGPFSKFLALQLFRPALQCGHAS